MAINVRRFGWVLLLAATVLITGEIVARLDDAAREGVPVTASPKESDLTIRDSLGTRGRPFGHYRQWRLNSVGFRGPEISRVRSSGCTRVAILGASETFGYYESKGKEYPAQLADTLKNYGCYEVLNAAVAGMSLTGQLQLWNNWVSTFQPDIVLIYSTPAFYLSSDPPRFVTAGKREARTVASGFSSRLLDRLKSRIEYPAFLQRRRVAAKINAELAGKGPGWVFTALPVDRLELYQFHLDSLVTSVRNHSAVPVLLTHAMRFSIPPRGEDRALLQAWRQFTPRATEEVLLGFELESAEMVRTLARKRDLALVDIAKHMTGRHEWFADFTHFNDEGSAVMAGRIAQVLKHIQISRISQAATH